MFGETKCNSVSRVCVVFAVVQVSVGAVAAAAVGKAKVYGPALEKPVKTSETSYLIVDCKEAGPGYHINPFNTSCFTLLLFEGFSAILV